MIKIYIFNSAMPAKGYYGDGYLSSVKSPNDYGDGQDEKSYTHYGFSFNGNGEGNGNSFQGKGVL